MTTIFQFEAAARNLSHFIIARADRLSRSLGFGYVDADVAPNTFEELAAAWANSRKTGLALPVWNGASEGTIYTNAGVNFAFRFWHDALHMIHNKGFNTADEITLGEMQTTDVKKAFGADSLEAKLMYADTAGQSMYAAAHNGEFPHDQKAFVMAYVGVNALQALPLAA